MRLATIKLHGAEIAGIVTGKGILPVAALNASKGTGWKEDMMSLIQAGHIPGLTKWYNDGGKEELETIPGLVPAEEVVYAPLYRNPKRIFGIGLNYADHAERHRLRRPHRLPRQLLQDGGHSHWPRRRHPAAQAEGSPEDHRRGGAGRSSWAGTAVTCPRRTGRAPSWATPPSSDMTEESILKGNDFVPGNPRYLCHREELPHLLLLRSPAGHA